MNELPGFHICFVGTSHMQGVGDPQCLGWVGRVCHHMLAQGTELIFYNLGIRGNTSENIKTRWYQEVFRRVGNNKKARVMFAFGVNDAVVINGKRRVSFEQTKENTVEILEKATERYQVLMMSPLPIVDEEMNERISEIVIFQEHLAAQYDVAYLNFFDQLRSGSKWLDEMREGDGAHPAEGGYKEVAELILASDGWKDFLK